MSKRLQFERMEIEKTRAGAKLSPDEMRLGKRLATSKSRIADKISQEMADITFYFESLAKHKELQELFDNESKDLMGLRQEIQKSIHRTEKGKHYPIYFRPETLQRLITAILAVESEGDESYRLSLLDVLQQIVYSKVVRQKPSNVTDEVTEIMLMDIKRALAWTKLYASNAKVKGDEIGYHRALGYSLRPTYPSRSYTKEIDHYGKIL